MGTTTRQVPFFSDSISIMVEDATEVRFVNRRTTVSEFSQGEPVSMEECIETGELTIKKADGRFISGKEVR